MSSRSKLASKSAANRAALEAAYNGSEEAVAVAVEVLDNPTPAPEPEPTVEPTFEPTVAAEKKPDLRVVGNRGREKWREFAVNRTSGNTHRVTVMVSQAVNDRLINLDYRLAKEGNPPINRSALVAKAIEVAAEDPDRWGSGDGERPIALQVRVSKERADQASGMRFSEKGRRNVSLILSEVVSELVK